MYPYDDMPGGANQAGSRPPWFKPRPTAFGGNHSGMAGLNSMVSALSDFQDAYKKPAPGAPMVGGQPWQPAPREGSPNLFQGAPNMGPQSGMPSAPPSSVMPPMGGQTSPMPTSPPPPPPSISPTSPVPFQGMGGPGMGAGGNSALSSLMSNPPGSGGGNAWTDAFQMASKFGFGQ